MKVGDKVRSLVGRGYGRTEGKVYEITDIDSTGDVTQYWYVNDEGNIVYTNEPETFELVKDNPEVLELDVWVEDYDSIYDIMVYHGKDEIDEKFIKERNLLKAKLIVEKPEEKKVEITAKQLEDAMLLVYGIEDAFKLKKELGL